MLERIVRLDHGSNGAGFNKRKRAIPNTPKEDASMSLGAVIRISNKPQTVSWLTFCLNNQSVIKVTRSITTNLFLCTTTRDRDRESNKLVRGAPKLAILGLCVCNMKALVARSHCHHCLVL